MSAKSLATRVALRHMDRMAKINTTSGVGQTAEEMLLDLLGMLRAQHWMYWTTHWTVGGKAFYGGHLLFQRLYDGEDDDDEGLEDDVDGLAEKIVGFFGADAVTSIDTMARAAGWILKWADTENPFDRALEAEQDLLDYIATMKEVLDGTEVWTLGLDAFVSELGNRHETNQYLLGQVMAEKGITASTRQAKVINTLWVVRNPNEHSSMLDIVSEVGPMTLGTLAIGTGAGRWKYEDTALHDDAKSAVKDAYDRLNRYYKGEIPKWVLRNSGGEKGWKSWKPSRLAGVVTPPQTQAPSAEGMFHLPESSEVREFAQTDAITNIPEVAEEAAPELDIPEAEAVEEAEEAPPTPEEIDEEPGAEDVSTLNRFLVDPPPSAEARVAELRRRYFDL